MTLKCATQIISASLILVLSIAFMPCCIPIPPPQQTIPPLQSKMPGCELLSKFDRGSFEKARIIYGKFIAPCGIYLVSQMGQVLQNHPGVQKISLLEFDSTCALTRTILPDTECRMRMVVKITTSEGEISFVTTSTSLLKRAYQPEAQFLLIAPYPALPGFKGGEHNDQVAGFAAKHMESAVLELVKAFSKELDARNL